VISFPLNGKLFLSERDFYLCASLLSVRVTNLFVYLSVLGKQCKVTTVDKFQGQQSDFVLLSLVRTSSVGHLSDVRRLVVALSRARLGLYVFCRQSVFEHHPALSSTFRTLCTRPTALTLVAGEQYPTSRSQTCALTTTSVHTVSDVSEMGTIAYQMAQSAIQKYAADEALAKLVVAAEMQVEETVVEVVPTYSIEAITMPEECHLKPLKKTFEIEFESDSDNEVI